jgi:hypothetical protein
MPITTRRPPAPIRNDIGRNSLWAGFAAFLLSMALGSTALADPLPLFTARYTLSKAGIPLGENIRTLTKAGDGGYLYQSVTHATGLLAKFVKQEIVERSEWAYEGEGQIAQPRPLEYLSRRSGKSDKWIKQIFNWEKNTTTNITSSKSWHTPLRPKIQDKLSYQLAIMNDLQHGRKTLEYLIADSDKIKNYRFVILGEERVKTAMGTLRTLKIRRTGDSRNTTVWCAVDFHYLPVVLEQHDDEDGWLKMQIESMQFEDQAPEGKKQTPPA